MTDRRKVVGIPSPVVPHMSAKRTQGSPHRLAHRPVHQANQAHLPAQHLPPGISVIRQQAASPANRQMAPPSALPKTTPIALNNLPRPLVSKT